MGDIIELRTLPLHQNRSYKISSSGFEFHVKSLGESGAAIGLSKWSDRPCYWIFIAIDGFTWIKNVEGGGNRSNAKLTPDLLSDTEFTKFWLSWDQGCLCLGKGDNPKPITSMDIAVGLKYVTFSSCENVVHWKLTLPPVLSRPGLMELNRGKLKWVTPDDQLPDGSLIGGYENEFLYIIRSKFRGSLTPGKFVPSLGSGFISWGGEAHEMIEFEVLCGQDCQWVPASSDYIPVTSVEVGYSEGHNSEALYLGRATHKGHVIPGKVQLSHKVCYIPYEDREIAKTEFEVLVSPFSNNHVVHPLLQKFDYGQISYENTDEESLP